MNQYDLMNANKKAILESGKKITPEQKQRMEILTLAKAQGCEPDLRNLFERYDKLLKNCNSDEERQVIAVMGIAELNKLLNVQAALVINGVEVMPAKGEIKEII